MIEYLAFIIASDILKSDISRDVTRRVDEYFDSLIANKNILSSKDLVNRNLAKMVIKNFQDKFAHSPEF